MHEKQSFVAEFFQLHASAYLWPKEQKKSSEDSVWKLSAPDYPKKPKFFSGLDYVRPEKLIVGKGADPILWATWKYMRRTLRDNFEGKDIIIVPEVLPIRFRQEHVLEPRSTATEKAKLRNLEIKRKMKKRFTQKSENILMIKKPLWCLEGSRSKHRSRRGSRLRE